MPAPYRASSRPPQRPRLKRTWLVDQDLVEWLEGRCAEEGRVGVNGGLDVAGLVNEGLRVFMVMEAMEKEAGDAGSTS